jgi:outer membrane receptor protein involved in Fe transport
MRRISRFSLLLYCFVSLLAISVIPLQLHGQAVYGSISGTVTDNNGAVVPNAAITVTNARKGTTDKTTTNESGNYSVTHLIPDVYNVRVEAPNFNAADIKGLQLSADTILRADAQLTVGNVSQSVEVTAEAPQLQTERADVATIFNERAVEQLPIFNRNFTSLLLATPGTTKMGWSHASSENPQGSQQIFVNGQQFAGTAYELDGTDNQDPILGIIVVNPNLDSVTETKITSQNYDAEFGKAIAGIVTAQTKSGSNNLHGSAFEFRRSDVFQARDPFANFQKDPITKKFLPDTLWNQFGGSVGGPVFKDKLFFFGDYQGTREKSGNSFLRTVPTTLVRNTCLVPGTPCNLSEYLNGGQNQIYNPANQTAFAGNIIPAGLISTQAINLLKQLPAPSTSGVINNYVANGFGIFDRDGYDVRIDNSTTQNLHIFGRYSYQRFNLSSKGAFGVAGGQGFGPGGFAGQSKTRNHSLSSGFDYSLSPTLITDFRFGYFRYNVNVTPNGFGTTPMQAAGVPGINTGSSFTTGFSQLSFSGNDTGAIQRDAGISEFGEGLDVARCNCPLVETENQVQFVNNWTKILGNHSFKFGGDIRYATNLRVPSDRHRTGEISFSRDFTSNPANAANPGGSALATFLLGEATSISRYVSTSTNASERQKRWFFYGQDTWRITPKLTLNYGLRWEIYFPETVNHSGNGALLNLDDGNLHVAGIGGVSSDMDVDNSYKNFAPRLGIAYQVTPKTVVRMGYGRSFDIGVFGSVFGHTVTQNLPVLANQNLNAPSKTTGVFTLAQGPPAPTFTPVPSNGLLPLPVGINGRARPFRMRIPTLDAYNLTVQHQITNTLSGEIAYVGNKGTHVFAGNNPDINANQPTNFGYHPQFADCTAATLFSPNCNTPRDPRRPFFNRFKWTQDITDFANSSSSNYNALQMKLDKRFSQGLQLTAHYTWSKALNFDQDYFAIQPHYGLVDFNRKHVFLVNSVYELPFGRGKPYMSNVSKAMDYLVGGFQMSGTLSWSSGLPFSVSYGECSSDIDTGPCWASKTGSPNINVSDLVTPATGSPYRQFFTPVSKFTTNGASGGGFTRPAQDTFGSRNSLYGPRYANIDFAVAKRFAITERVNTQFRLEVFNLFNHPQLANPQSCIDCSDQGRITGLAGNTGQMRNLQFGLRVDF